MGLGQGNGPQQTRRRNPFPDKMITIRRAHGVAPIGKRETIVNYTWVPRRISPWAEFRRPVGPGVRAAPVCGGLKGRRSSAQGETLGTLR